MTERLKFFVAGFFIGIAELLPGISGSTVAVGFGIYDRIIKTLSEIRPKNFSYNIKNLNKIFHLDLMLLLLISMVSSIIFFSKAILYLFMNFNSAFEISLSVVMILISLYIIKDFIFQKQRLFLFIIIGAFFGFAINQIPNLETSNNFIILVLMGLIAFSFFLVPGISGSAILLSLGSYKLVIEAIAEINFTVLVPFAIGSLIALYFLPKIIFNLVDKFNEQLMSFFSGLIFVAGLSLVF
ncbi:MAG: hypothetical protein CMD75_02395 [Gammaproteobacteria bacterium]|nr:hypothetical protein [Gammaproteobacteria bacterium]|tara:strand:- start:1410 stop:2129 length:720 start_codon:yes stop_codon:yes gene_type:complete